MRKKAKNIYSKVVAAIVLFTAEATLASLLFLVSVFTFLLVAHYVFWEKKTHIDEQVFAFLHQHVTDVHTSLMLFFTFLGNYQMLITANILLTFYFLFFKRHKWYSITIPSIALSSVIVMSLLKLLFNRPRPLLPLLEPAQGLSFPSGHAMSSVTFFGLLIYYVFKRQKQPLVKVSLIALLTALILMIGISRVYLRVHYASDVVAGYCAGVIWLTIAIWSLRKIEFYTKKEIQPVLDAEQTPAKID